MKTERMLPIALTACTLSLTSCFEEYRPDYVYVSNQQWGEPLRGDNRTVKQYPELTAVSWEYTFEAGDYPETALKLSGSFPRARYFSVAVYDDRDGSLISTLSDVGIVPASGRIHPFKQVTSAEIPYNVYVIPSTTSDDEKKRMRNTCEYEAGTRKISVFVRLWLGEDEKGGVEMPELTAFRIDNGEIIPLPGKLTSSVWAERPGSDTDFPSAADLTFRVPTGTPRFANPHAAAVCSPNRLQPAEVMLFDVQAPKAPAAANQNARADVRYWSVSLGDEETYTVSSLFDRDITVGTDGIARFVVADQGSSVLDDLRHRCDTSGYNLLTWDVATRGEAVMLLYRNLLTRADYAPSLHLLEPYQNAHEVLGAAGPLGAKVSEDAFLTAEDPFAAIVRPEEPVEPEEPEIPEQPETTR